MPCCGEKLGTQPALDRPEMCRTRSKGQNWFPKENSAHDMGHKLLGPQCFRDEDRKHACFCGTKTCRGVGCSPCMVRMPQDRQMTEQVITALGVHDTEKRQLTREKPRNCRVGPWHFDPQHRESEEETGTWRLLPCNEEDVCHDNDGKKWTGMPPANCSPSAFVDEETNRDHRCRLPNDTWMEKFGSAWPAWVLEHARVESSNRSSLQSPQLDQMLTCQIILLLIHVCSGM